MKTISFIIFLTIIFSIIFVSAMQIDFYYSTTCPYCEQISPYVNYFEQKYPNKIFNWYETKNYQQQFKEYDFTGVPAFVINTDDGREIKWTGANINKLNCELQEMSTKECVTYSVDSCIGGSWFVE